MKLLKNHQVSLQTIAFSFHLWYNVFIKGGNDLYRETGVYVFPEGKNITSYLFTHHENGDSLSTTPKTRYTEQLIDILEADMSSLEELTNECLAHKKDIIGSPKNTEDDHCYRGSGFIVFS